MYGEAFYRENRAILAFNLALTRQAQGLLEESAKELAEEATYITTIVNDSGRNGSGVHWWSNSLLHCCIRSVVVVPRNRY